MTELIGQTIDAFRIESEIGRGGMAVVYRARQLELERLVALKVLPPELSRDQSYIARFLQEARSAAALEHPHIVPIYDVGAAAGFHYIAMKYIAGRTLKQAALEQGGLTVAQAATLLAQVADALDYAHARGIIHRDIKPSNVMVEPGGWVYLTDFGLARDSAASRGLTLAGTVMGTPEYMSPEQAQGLITIGPATDIYALGVVLYELLTGQFPFEAETPLGMLVARLQQTPRPPREYRPDLPLAAEDVIMRALARRPEARFRTAGELVAALADAAGTRLVPAPARPASQPHLPLAAQLPPTVATPLPPGGPPPAPTPAPLAQANTNLPTMVADGPTVAVHAETPPAVPPATPVAPQLAQPLAAAPTLAAAQASAQDATLPFGTQPPPKRRRRIGLVVGVALAVLLMLALTVGFLVQSGGQATSRRNLAVAEQALAQPGGFDDAIAAYQQVLATDADNLDAHLRLALIYTLRGRPLEAEAAAQAAMNAEPKSAVAHALMAAALNEHGNYQPALVAANRAIELAPNSSLGYSIRALVQSQRAIETSDRSLLRSAADDADRAITLSSGEENMLKSLSHSARGYVYWQEYTISGDDDKVGRGVEEFNQAIGLQPQVALFHLNLGYFYDAQGDHDRARDKFNDALKADSADGRAHVGLGWNHYYRQEFEQALAEFDKAIALNAEDAEPYVGKSRIYQEQPTPDHTQAVEMLQKAVERAPENPRLLAYLGWAHRAWAISQEYGSEEQRQAYGNAEYNFRQALTVNERYADARTGLGWVLQDQADVLGKPELFEQAIEQFKLSLEVKDDQAVAYCGLGWSYAGLQQYEQAIQAYDQAIDLNDSYEDALYGLGLAYEASGQKSEAHDAFEKAAELGSERAAQAAERVR